MTHTSPPEFRYVIGLDVLRFAASFLVAVFHLGFWAWAFPEGQVGRVSLSPRPFWVWDEVTSLGWVGVQIFFVISGFVIAYTAERARAFQFFVSRVARLVPAVWICATVTLAVWLLADTLYPADIWHPRAVFLAYVKSLLFVPYPSWIDSVYWTLGVEVSFYSVVLALLAIRRFHWLKPVACCIGLASTLYWIAFVLGAPHREGALLANLQVSRDAQLLLLQHGCFFAVGVLLWLQLIWRPSRDQVAWLALFVAGGCLQIAGESSLKLDKTGLSYSPLYPALVWIASLVAFVAAVQANARLHRLPASLVALARRLGLMTYPLYLLHNVVGGAVMGLLVTHGVSPEAAFTAALLFALVASWLVSVVPEPALQRATKAMLVASGARVRLFVKGTRARAAREQPSGV